MANGNDDERNHDEQRLAGAVQHPRHDVAAQVIRAQGIDDRRRVDTVEVHVPLDQAEQLVRLAFDEKLDRILRLGLRLVNAPPTSTSRYCTRTDASGGRSRQKMDFRRRVEVLLPIGARLRIRRQKRRKDGGHVQDDEHHGRRTWPACAAGNAATPAAVSEKPRYSSAASSVNRGAPGLWCSRCRCHRHNQSSLRPLTDSGCAGPPTPAIMSAMKLPSIEHDGPDHQAAQHQVIVVGPQAAVQEPPEARVAGDELRQRRAAQQRGNLKAEERDERIDGVAQPRVCTRPPVRTTLWPAPYARSLGAGCPAGCCACSA